MAVLMAGLLLLGTLQTEDVNTLATEAGVDVTDLQGAVNTTQLEPRAYLEMTGELKQSRPPTRAPVSSVWDRLAQCESNGRWHIDAYHDGGLQFLPSTWTAYGGGKYARYAWQATREQQIDIAQRVQAAAGWGQWPVCSRRLGLR